MLRVLMIAMLAFGTSAAFAQHHPQQQHVGPYTGLQSRSVKALSTEQIADLKAGRGMQLALPAELNGYPGPLHVLELSSELDLSPAQRARMQELYAAMKAEAVPLGERLIAGETELDQLFAGHTITPAQLESTSANIGRIQAALRTAHLKYHLITVEVLSPEQVRRYNELRGYTQTIPHRLQ